jgi:hypothetical protein
MYYGMAPVNQSTLQGEFLFQWVELGSTQACSRVQLVFPTIDSHLKHVLHWLITLQLKLTTQKVEPADGCQEA